jgi:hypothetical protein
VGDVDNQREKGTERASEYGASSEHKLSIKHHVDADDDSEPDCGGFCFAQGDNYIGVPLDTYFPEPSSFPYFVQPYALNAQVYGLVN